MEGQLGTACNGGSIIASVLEHLKLEDVQLLLENRGMPSIGDKEQLTERLQVQIRPSACVVPILVIHSSTKNLEALSGQPPEAGMSCRLLSVKRSVSLSGSSARSRHNM